MNSDFQRAAHSDETARMIPVAQSVPSVPTGGARSRWLFIDGADAFGGHEAMLLRWLEELHAQRTADCFLLARAGSRLIEKGAQYSSVRELPQSTNAGRLNAVLRDMRAFMRAVRDVNPDVCIVAEGCLLSQPLFAQWARLMGKRVFVYVPLVQTSTSMGFGSGRLRDALVRRWYANLPHGWITITEEQAQDFRSWAGVRRPILTLNNTVAPAIEKQIVDVVERSRSSVPKNERTRILVLGRLDAQQKGLDALLDYMQANPQLGEHITVTFAGDGPFETQVRAALSSDPALRRWLSLQSWSATAEVMRNHDVLLMSSRFEGVPLVMLEAMALGVPVVAPDLPGIRAFIGPENLFAKGDMQAAFEIIERLADPALRATIVRRNREYFDAHASNGSFAAAVKLLTQQIRVLALRRRVKT